MAQRAPNTLVAYYEPGPEEAMLFAYLGEFILKRTELYKKKNDIVEAAVIRDQLNEAEAGQPMRFTFLVDDYPLDDEDLIRKMLDSEVDKSSLD